MVFFYTKVIETRKSKINTEVQVIKLFGSYRLIVGKYTQSGGLIDPIWKSALKWSKKRIKTNEPKILILGLGAGTAARICNNFWPQSEITGIEIDPVVIDFAKEYFKLDSIPNLETVNTDAIKWVHKNTHKKKYDLILVDMYIGSEPPLKTSSEQFLESIKDILQIEGFTIFNRLLIKEKTKDVEEFKTKLELNFPNLKKIRTPANAVFAVWN